MGVISGSLKGGDKKKRKRHRIPVGIKVLINYSIILGAFYLLFGLIFPSEQN